MKKTFIISFIFILTFCMYGCSKECKNGHNLIVSEKINSCENGGAVQLNCKNCKYTDILYIPANSTHELIMDDEKSIAATCENEGVNYENCKYCNHIVKTILLPLGHDYKTTINYDSTCDKLGEQEKRCLECGKIVIEEIDYKEHDYVVISSTSSTCSSNGSATYKCSNCGKTKTETLAKSSHTYSGGKCVNCGASDPNYINISSNSGATVYYYGKSRCKVECATIYSSGILMLVFKVTKIWDEDGSYGTTAIGFRWKITKGSSVVLSDWWMTTGLSVGESYSFTITKNVYLSGNYSLTISDV